MIPEVSETLERMECEHLCSTCRHKNAKGWPCNRCFSFEKWEMETLARAIEDEATTLIKRQKSLPKGANPFIDARIHEIIFFADIIGIHVDHRNGKATIFDDSGLSRYVE